MSTRFRLASAFWILTVAAITFALARESSIQRDQSAALLRALDADPCFAKGQAGPYPIALAFRCSPKQETIAAIIKSNEVWTVTCASVEPDAEHELLKHFVRQGDLFRYPGPRWSRIGALEMVWLAAVVGPLAYRYRAVRLASLVLLALLLLTALLVVLLDAPSATPAPAPADSSAHN
ncbi:MAG: hypothetical protein U0836_06860 [Pirellulales bacterium]